MDAQLSWLEYTPDKREVDDSSSSVSIKMGMCLVSTEVMKYNKRAEELYLYKNNTNINANISVNYNRNELAA